MRGPTAQRISAPPGQVEVEIVDDDAAPLTQGPTLHAPRRVGVRRGRPVRARRVVLVAALALVVVAVNVAESRTEAERVAAVASLPGVLDGVDGPLVPAWTVEGSQLSGLTAHLVLVWTPDGTLAVDPGTGEVAWRWDAEVGVPGVPRATETCAPLRTPDAPELPALELAGPVLTGPAGDPEGALVACVRESPAVRQGDHVVTQQVRVTLLDADDGTPLHGWVTRGRTIVVQHLEGDDVVAAVREVDGRLEAARWDVRTGERRWRTVTEREVEGPLHGVWQAAVEGGVLTVDQPVPLRLDVDTGAVLGPGVAPAAVGADGAGRADDEALVPRPAPVTDASDPPLLLVAGVDDVTGIDPGTGEVRWVRGQEGTPLAQVGGLVVLREEGATVALDAGSGDLVWSVPTAPHVRFGPMLDGRVLLLPVRGASVLSALPGARPRPVLDLVAVDASDGLERWRAALPAGTFAISATPDGHVVVETTGGVVGLR